MIKVTERDIIIKSPAGLYLVIREDGQVGVTNLKHASHFSRRKTAKLAIERAKRDDLNWIDLNNRKQKEI